MIALRSSRLSLTPFSIGDAGPLFLIRGDPEAMRYWDWPADRTQDETLAIAQRMLEDIASGATRIWTIRLASDSAFVGVVDLSEIARNEADLGFMIRRDHWGKGYAVEAASAIVDQAWSEGLARLGARIHAGNARSRKVLEKLGFLAGALCEVEIRPGIKETCEFFSLGNPQGSNSLSQ